MTEHETAGSAQAAASEGGSLALPPAEGQWYWDDLDGSNDWFLARIGGVVLRKQKAADYLNALEAAASSAEVVEAVRLVCDEFVLTRADHGDDSVKAASKVLRTWLASLSGGGR